MTSPTPDIAELYDEIHERALRLASADPFEEVYDDAEVRGLRTCEIEITEVRSGAEGHSLTVYVANEYRVVSAMAYSWEHTPGMREPRVKSHLGYLRTALDIMRTMMVLDDLANA